MKRILYSITGLILFMLSCAEHENILDVGMEKTAITICSTYPNLITRAVVDGGFSVGDEIGIFVVDRNEEGQPGTMSLQGNRASNMRFSLNEDGTWTSPTQLYWSPQGHAADFYGYYPFNNDLASVTSYQFMVEANQESTKTNSTINGYVASDLLWTKKENVNPTTETINLQYQHLMAGICIRLEMGAGFTAEEWAQFDKTILLKNTILSGSVDLTTGTTTVGSGSQSIINPLPHNGNWRAVVFPQTIASGKELVSITIDGQSYSLKKDKEMNYVSGKMHQFTIQVDRKSPLENFDFTVVDEAITNWIDDDDMHEGLVRQYLVVELQEAGTLATTLAAMGKSPTDLLALKIVGPMNEDDYGTINTMKKLTHLNLIKAIPENGVLNGIEWIPLEKVFFPEKGLKILNGFNETHLTGSLVIPEGVEEVGGFWGNNYTGTLTLPSTLKIMHMRIDPFKGDIAIPDRLEVWEPSGFGNEGKLTGTLNLPSTLKKVGYVPDGMTGTINIPQGCEITGGYTFAASKCTSLVLPEGLTEIPYSSFSNSEIRGEIVLPSTIKHIGASAFAGSKISKIFFPDALKIMDDGGYNFEGVFSDCKRLSGTLTLPKNVTRIPKGCFLGCSMLTGLVIPKGTLILDERCFEGCNNLNSIVCEGEDPPLVVNDAFLGVPKDNFTVEVPKGCVEKYRQARGWSDFKRIAEYQNFVCRPAQVGALNSVHQEELVLNADGAWTVSKKPDWVTLSKTSGTGKTALTLTIQQMSKGQGNRVDTVKFDMNGYTTSCVVRQYDYQYDEDSYLTLQTATKGNRGGIDIVFVGDGWDGQSISDGSYLDLIEYQAKCFFSIEPYRSMRDYFNVYITFPLSQEKGVNTMYTYVNNRFGTLQGFSSLLSVAQTAFTSTQLFMETDEVQQYVLDKTPVVQDNLWRTLVIAVPNSTEYEGNTVFNNGGLTISICPPSEQAYPRDTRGVIQHEAGGHGFGRLGDESISRNAFATSAVKQSIDEMHGRGWYENLATTGKLHDVPWAEFIFDPDYSDRVDVYEGGYGYTRGIYRSEVNSCMNYGIPYYNTPSRLSIYKRIKDYAGESWLMSEFREQDTFAWGPTTITRSASQQIEDLNPITNGNHHMPTITRFREIGDKVRAIRARLKNERNKK